MAGGDVCSVLAGRSGTENDHAELLFGHQSLLAV
jgi:hypothetical protein